MLPLCRVTAATNLGSNRKVMWCGCFALAHAMFALAHALWTSCVSNADPVLRSCLNMGLCTLTKFTCESCSGIAQKSHRNCSQMTSTGCMLTYWLHQTINCTIISSRAIKNMVLVKSQEIDHCRLQSMWETNCLLTTTTMLSLLKVHFHTKQPPNLELHYCSSGSQ